MLFIPKSKTKNQKSGIPPTPWRLMGMGLELGAIIGGLTYLGHLGDTRWGTHPWLALSGAVLSTVGGSYNLAKEILKKPAPRKTVPTQPDSSTPPHD